MRKISKSTLLCLMAILLCACSPASKEDVQRYAENKYGEAEYIRTEEVDDREVIYYFHDKEYGFEYYVASYVKDVLIDGAKFGESESKGSNFDKAYYTYILSQVQDDLTALEEVYGVVILDGLDPEIQLDYKYQLAEVYSESEDILAASEVAKAIHDLFAGYDTRKYWQDMRVTAYDEQGEELGIYSYKYNQWMTPEEERDTLFLERIQMLNDEAEFVRKEQRKFTDTGLTLAEVATILGSEPTTEDSIVTYYYFMVDGKEYFLADIMVSKDGTAKWYTNYEED